MSKEIILSFKNYKLFQDTEFKLDDYNVFMVVGNNEYGKTTVITALQEIFGVIALTDDPVTTGSTEGSKTFQIPDKDGNMVTVKHTYDRSKAKGKFVAFDKDGNPLRKVGEIRDLLGTYSRITTEQFFDKARTAEGRREIINEYFVQFLTEGELGLLKKLQDLEGVNYDLRTAAKKELDTAESKALDYKPTPADEQLLSQKVASHKLLTGLKSQREGVMFFDNNMKVLQERDSNLRFNLGQEDNKLAKAITDTEEEVGYLKEEITELEISLARCKKTLKGHEAFLKNPDTEYRDRIDGLKKQIVENNNSMDRLREESGDPKMTLAELDARLEKGEKMMSDIAIRESRSKDYSKAKKEHEEAEKEWTDLENKVNKARRDIKALYASSALPAGVQIENDTFTLQGFEFSETQISESRAKLVIAEIMCQVDTSPLLVMGNAGSFGEERLNELCALAEKHNKIMFLEKVVDDTEDVRVVGVVHNKVTKSDDKLF